MDHAEMVKKLCEKSGASEALAYDALEKAAWNILDAIIFLEREGKIAQVTSSASTSTSAAAYGDVKPTAYAKRTLRDRIRRHKQHL